MATGQNPFDREVINVRERPLSSDINLAQALLHHGMMEFVDRLFGTRVGDTDDTANRPSNGFISNGLRVRTVAGMMQVNVTPGLGFFTDGAQQTIGIDSISGLDDNARVKPVVLAGGLLGTTPETIAIDAGPGVGFARKDIIEVKIDRRRENSISRDTLDPGSGTFIPGLVLKNLAYSLDGRQGRVVTPANSTTGIGYKVGAVTAHGGLPVDWTLIPEPPTTPGYVKIAILLIEEAVVDVPTNRIVDERPLLCPYNGFWVGGQIANTAAAISGANGFIMPPGTQMTVIPGGSNYNFDVWLFGGRGFSVVTPWVQIINGSPLLQGSLEVVQITDGVALPGTGSGITLGPISNTDAGNLATFGSPPLQIAPGTASAKIQCRPKRLLLSGAGPATVSDVVVNQTTLLTDFMALCRPTTV